MNTKLNVKQWSIAALAVFIIMTIIGIALRKLGIEPWAVGPATALTGGVQPDPDTQRILIYLGRIVLAALFTYIYTKGYEGKAGIGEGLRYGVWVGLLIYTPAFLGGLATMDSSQTIQFIKGVLELIVCGAVVGQLYKPAKAA